MRPSYVHSCPRGGEERRIRWLIRAKTETCRETLVKRKSTAHPVINWRQIINAPIVMSVAQFGNALSGIKNFRKIATLAVKSDAAPRKTE